MSAIDSHVVADVWPRIAGATAVRAIAKATGKDPDELVARYERGTSTGTAADTAAIIEELEKLDDGSECIPLLYVKLREVLASKQEREATAAKQEAQRAEADEAAKVTLADWWGLDLAELVRGLPREIAESIKIGRAWIAVRELREVQPDEQRREILMRLSDALGVPASPRVINTAAEELRADLSEAGGSPRASAALDGLALALDTWRARRRLDQPQLDAALTAIAAGRRSLDRVASRGTAGVREARA